jgi:hypothetical protein
MFLTKITLVGIESYLGSDYLSLLIHAPALKELTTFAIDFSFEDLELLHATLPRLCSVRFDSLELRNSNFPENVQPALGIISFAVTGYTVVRMETEQKLFKYIGEKYPNLCDLAYDADNLVIRDDTDEECVYKEGWLPLMKSLGPQLKRLSINPEHDIEDLLDVLDGCQIDEFNLRYQTGQMALEKLGKSNPAKYFKSLKLYGVQCLRFGWLRNMSMLTELYVHYGRNPKGDSIIQLNDVVNVCGDRLESLKLSYVDIKFDDLLTHDAVYPIKRLELEMVHLPPDIDAYISYSFPSLRTLKFNKCKLSGRHLILPNIHLYYLEIRESLPNNDGGVLVKTLNDNQKRFHSVRHNIYECTSFERDFAFQDVATYPSIVSSPFDENQPQHIPFLTLVCHSLQTLFILNDSY